MSRHSVRQIFTARIVVAAALLLAVVGCGDDGGPAADAVATTVDTADGVVRIHNAGAAPELRPERILSLGAVGLLGETSPEEFARVRGLVADDQGRVYVGDGQALEVRVFDQDGAFLRRIGREGSGPGEIAGLHAIGWAGDDSLVAMDYGNARLSLLGSEGEPLGQWQWAPITGSGRFLFNGAPGEFYAFSFAPERQNRTIWIRYTGAGPVDTLDVPRLDEPPPGTHVTCFGDGIGFFSNPHGERMIAVPAPGGERVVAMSSEYRLAFIDPAGDTVRVVSRDAEALPLTDADWAPADSAYQEFRGLWSGTRCEGSIQRPRDRPVLKDVFFDHDGRLVVERDAGEGTALDLFDDGYRWTGTVPLPERDASEPPFIRDGRLYLVTRDSLDVQHVQVLGLEQTAD